MPIPGPRRTDCFHLALHGGSGNRKPRGKRPHGGSLNHRGQRGGATGAQPPCRPPHPRGARFVAEATLDRLDHPSLNTTHLVPLGCTPLSQSEFQIHKIVKDNNGGCWKPLNLGVICYTGGDKRILPSPPAPHFLPD